MKRNLSKKQFIAELKALGIIPLYMTDSHGRKLLDRVGNDEAFANAVDDFGYGRRGWALTYKEGGQ